MNSDFLTFQEFNDPALAEEFINLLTENGINYDVEEGIVTASINPLTAINNELAHSYRVKISADHFNRVTELLKKRDDQYINEVEPDYYLFDFTNDELIDVLEKEDEWSSFDYALAKNILHERGVTIDTKKLADINETRLAELRKPEQHQTFWIFLGYLLALLGGVLGIFIGWHLSSHKKTLPNGEQVYNYNEHDRKHGRIIFYIAICSFVISVILNFIIASRQY